MKKVAYVLCPHEPYKDPRVSFEIDELKAVYNVIAIGILTSFEKKSEKTQSNYKLLLLDLKKNAWKKQIIDFFNLINNYTKSKTLRLVNYVLKLFYVTDMYKLLFRLIPQYQKFNHLLYELSYSIPLIKNSDIPNKKPYLVQANDVYTLLAGVILKTEHNSKLIYDSHELYPESIPSSPEYLKHYLWLTEKSLIGYADTVFAVTPQIAKKMEDDYKLKKIKVLPNAEKWKDHKIDYFNVRKVVFLYQGGFLPERGLEELIEQWKHVDHDKAILYMRGPKNSFLNKLKELAKEQIDNKSLIFLDSVTEDVQVEMMKGADVGIIPYLPTSLNNKYSCPNKLSQYMQAGLALLSNKLDFIESLVKKKRIGLIYDLNDRSSLLKCIKTLLDREKLDNFKKNSYNYGKIYFNWDVIKNIYIREIRVKD
ncbi:MAG: glycosyltransferase [Patescibacteria group bacterium]